MSRKEYHKIYCFLTLHENPPTQLSSLHYAKIGSITIKNLFATAETWPANFVSFFTGTYPSHNGIWENNDDMGPNIDSIANYYSEEEHSSHFIGPNECEPLVKQLNFTTTFTSEQDETIHAQLMDFLDQEPINNFFLTYVTRSWNTECEELIHNELLRSQSSGEEVLIITGRIGVINNKKKHVQEKQNQEKNQEGRDEKGEIGNFMHHSSMKLPFYLFSTKLNDHIEKKELYSLVDIFPNVLMQQKKSVPYSMVGKKLPGLLKDEKEEPKKSRDHILFEYKNGNKSLITKKHKMDVSITKKKEEGNIFDLIKDPNETDNLWNNEAYKNLKQKMMLQFLWAQMQKEVTPMPRIAAA